MLKLLAIAATLIALTPTANAQGYVPIGLDQAAIKPGASKLVLTRANLAVKGLSGLASYVATVGVPTREPAAQFATCANPPTVNDIGGNFEVKRYVMTRNAASNLNIIAGIGKADIEGSGSQLIAVFDYSRTKDCLATDGKTTVVYGQSIRTIMTFESTDAKANVTFPLVAAAATVSGKSSAVSVKNIGFDDDTMSTKALALSGMELSVSNYADFNAKHEELLALAGGADAAKRRVERLGIVPAIEEDDLIETMPKAFAIQQIKDGKSCEDAKQKFNNSTDADGIKLITSSYASLTGGCSTAKPNSQQIAKAKDYLRGMKVSN